MKYPPLPKTVTTMLGPVPVELVDKFADDDSFGQWHRERRTIEILKGLSREIQWSTLFHEIVHTALDDSGVACVLTEPQQEAICECISTARMRERFG
jgi:hypothetical protein